MPKRRPEKKSAHAPLNPALMLQIRHLAHRSGIPAAEVMRNHLVTDGIETPSLPIDGLVADTPDFDAELVGLLNYEKARTADPQVWRRPVSRPLLDPSMGPVKA